MNSATQNKPLATKVTEAVAYEVIRLAQLNLGKGAMVDSAAVSLEDAQVCFNKGDFTAAYNRARTSLKYSVGLFGKDYATAERLVRYTAR